MKETNKKQGRKFNRAKWNWDDLSSIKPSNDEIVERFEAWLEEQEAKEREFEVSKVRSRAKIQMRRENAQKVVALSLVSIVGILIGVGVVELIVRFIL